jgi:hypothetical protein
LGDILVTDRKMTTEFTNKLDKISVKYCFNEQDYELPKLKYIIVGDNPGKTEYKESKFFIGASEQKLRRHFKTNELIDNFDIECAVFNKTFIHTTKTEELESIRKDI